MEDETGDETDIPRSEGVAFVREDFVVERRDRKTVLLDSREESCECELDDSETEV